MDATLAAAASAPALRGPESGCWRTRSNRWETALHRVTLGSYSECRRAVVNLRWLCQELSKELGETNRPPESPDRSEDARFQLRLILRVFQGEWERFNTQGELGDLLSLGRALLGYLTAQAELEEMGLFPVPAHPWPLFA